MTDLPLPPDDLAKRAGGTVGEAFEAQGQGIKEFIVRSLPEDYDFANKRVLDFGCGSGRVLRHFQTEAQKAEFWACDVYHPSIQWLSRNLPACFRVFSNTDVPPLPIESNYFDLIYVISVFTHLTTTWEAWLLELRRVLKPGGILLVTFHNRMAYEYITGQRFDEQNAGMLVTREDLHWDQGGPMVYHSYWWIQKHWGQFFDIEYISREGLFDFQSLAFLVKRQDALDGDGNLTCPVLQPYPYQCYNPDFRGGLDVPNRRSSSLRYWHGLEVRTDKGGESIASGWFVSKAGRITDIKFMIDDNEVISLPGTNRDREDVEVKNLGWPYSLHSALEADSLHSGFEADLKLGGYETGEYELKVIATDSTGQQHEIQFPLLVSRKGAVERLAANTELAQRQAPCEIVAEHEQETVTPRVTVAVSLFNYRRHIIECLESVKSQTISNLDLIVVDDCSTDGSPELVRKWFVENGNRFTRYLLIRHEVNEGLSSARNSGFAHARTEHVFVLDADNLLYPRCLERLVAALDNCDASFAYCYLEKFGDVSGLQNTRPWSPATLQHGNTIDAMVLLRKGVWETVSGYSTGDVMRFGWEDFELWFKIARIKGWGVLVPEMLARYRVHKGSMLNTVTNPNADRLWAHLRSVYSDFFHGDSPPP